MCSETTQPALPPPPPQHSRTLSRGPPNPLPTHSTPPILYYSAPQPQMHLSPAPSQPMYSSTGPPQAYPHYQPAKPSQYSQYPTYTTYQPTAHYMPTLQQPAYEPPLGPAFVYGTAADNGFPPSAGGPWPAPHGAVAYDAPPADGGVMDGAGVAGGDMYGLPPGYVLHASEQLTTHTHVGALLQYGTSQSGGHFHDEVRPAWFRR
jgi:hypothetical protein